MYKIGILSMQRICNYGSFLQAYGLKKVLKSMKCTVEFVDYHPGKCLLPSETGLRRKLSKVAGTLHTCAPLREKLRYIQYKRQFAERFIPFLDITEQRNYSPELDLLIIGSDEVFNCCQNNPDVGFSPELFGVNHRAKRIISYAASFGNTTLEKLEYYGVSEQVASWLKAFDAVSVRDVNSGWIVETLTGKKPFYHSDPVLISDLVEEKSVKPVSVSKTPYILLYSYTGRFKKEECAAIAAYAVKKRLQIFCMGGVQDCCDRFIDCDPFQVIDYFQGAACVVTDTFHGAILSVITRQNFAVFVRESGYGNSEKIKDLLKRIHLTERLIDNIQCLEEILTRDINMSTIETFIAKSKMEAIDYLKREIQLCHKNS